MGTGKQLGILVVLAFVFIWLFTANGEKLAKQNSSQAADAACDQMMSDSAPGNERRMTRQICDKLKAKNK